MSRLTSAFATAASPRLVTYVTAGDPDIERSRQVLTGLVRGGADVIEVGVPFSDPVADGPAVQRGSERALAAGTTLGTSLDLVADLRRESDVPVVLFTYVNPVLRMGFDAFADRARTVGVDGVLLLDIPIEEFDEAGKTLEQHAIDPIFLVSPTTTEARLTIAAARGRGFLYAISRLGVTGVRDTVAGSARPLVERIRAVSDLPVALGFGISRPEHVREVVQYADAAVVGSAIVNVIGEAAAAGRHVGDAVAEFVTWLKGGR